MSKKNQVEATLNTNTNTNSIEGVVTTQVEPTKTYVIPLDGTGGETYITEQGSVSKAIRTLIASGYTRGEVAKMLNKRYQHVRNVMITPIKKG